MIHDIKITVKELDKREFIALKYFTTIVTMILARVSMLYFWMQGLEEILLTLSMGHAVELIQG